MVTIPPYWPWSLAVLFIIRIGPSGSSPTILRSNGAGAVPLAELQLSSCSQQLEKLKTETRRHISALNAIAGNSMRTGWRNRRLLAATQPEELKSKPISNTFLIPGALADPLSVRLSGETEEKGRNALGKYLSSLNDSGWVSRCLNGGKCRKTDVVDKPNEILASENPGSTGYAADIRSDQADKVITAGNLVNDSNSKIKAENGTLLFDMGTKQIGVVPDSVIKQNSTEFNRIIDLFPLNNESAMEFENDASRPKVGDSIGNDRNDTFLSNGTVEDNQPKESGNSYDNGECRNQAESLNRKRKPNKYTEDPETRTTQGNRKGRIDHDSVRDSSPSSEESSSNSAENYALVLETDPKPFQSNSLIYYNHHFLPFTTQNTPMTYYQKYPRSEVSSEETFAPNTELRAPGFSGMSNGKGLFDKMVANYGNDLFKRSSTGKRESEFYNSKTKEAVTTSYPEVPSTWAGTSDAQLFTRLGHGGNGSDSNVYLFVGGNWVADFKDNARLFYIQPQTRRSARIGPFTEATANIDSSQTYNQPSAYINRNCPPTGNIASELYPPPSYSQPSYTDDEWIPEHSRVAASVGYGSRTANDMKVPFMVAARNGYSWYDYDSLTNDLQSTPTNRPFSGGPVTFPNTGEFGNIPSDRYKNGVYKQKIDNLNYEDALVNFPQQKYEPSVVGSHDHTSSKPEDFMEHDISTADMFAVGTQLLAVLPLVPSERRASGNADDATYGDLVADVSARSGPSYVVNRVQTPKNTNNNYPVFTSLTNSAMKAPALGDSPGVRPLDRLDIQAPSNYFSPSWSNEFEFVSGQWIKRKPATDLASSRFLYDGIVQRQNRDIEMSWPHKNPSNDVQPLKFNSGCFRGKRKSSHSLLDSSQNDVLPPPSAAGVLQERYI